MAHETLVQAAPDTNEQNDDQRNPLWPDDVKALDELANEAGTKAAQDYALELAGERGSKGRTIEVTDPDSGEVTVIPVASIGKAAVKPPRETFIDPAYEQARVDNHTWTK